VRFLDNLLDGRRAMMKANADLVVRRGDDLIFSCDEGDREETELPEKLCDQHDDRQEQDWITKSFQSRNITP